MTEILTKDINKYLFRDYPCIKRYLQDIYNSPSTINKLITYAQLHYSDNFRYLNIVINDTVVKSCPVPEETQWNLRKYHIWFEASLGVLTEPTPIMFQEGL